ncbi:MAG: hypothetical protein EB054_03090 [Actinobacteria bacterium]|nr:hypothetical protein [Actinomycetota bacterium]
MNKKKMLAATALAGVAITLGTAGGASAHGPMGGNGGGLTTILNGLVSKGTLTQAQVDAINKALADARAAGDAARTARRAAFTKVVTDTLGITEATLTSRLQAGDSLATIAGAKKDALITALVALETKEIDDAVAAGKLTAAQATTMKANVKARVTAMVENTRGMGRGMGHDGMGKGGRF